MKQHWLDGSVLLSPDKSRPTCTGIFKVFGKHCNLSAMEMKDKLIDWMCNNRAELANCMAIALNQSKQSLPQWMQKVTLHDDFVLEELTVYCLSRLTGLHVLIYTKDFCW